MLYYTDLHTSRGRLYRTRRDATLLLTRFKTELERDGQSLVDYLLLPTSLEALTYCPHSLVGRSQVPDHLVLDLLAHLARMGKLWPYSGTHELYNGGLCCAELGKSGSSLLPYPLSLIIAVKERSTAVGCDQLA